MLDKIDRQIIVEISKDIDICSNPYDSMARRLNITVEELLTRLRDMMDKGYVKRISPIIRHHNTEYVFNALTAWKVQAGEKERLVDLMKAVENISHVYERETNTKWPYSIYGMLHGRSKEEVEEIIDKILKEIHIDDYKVLYTKKELKKTSPNMEYLLKDGK